MAENNAKKSRFVIERLEDRIAPSSMYWGGCNSGSGRSGSCKSHKSGSGKSHKSGSHKSNKSCKSNKSHKSSKSCKSNKSNKSNKCAPQCPPPKCPPPKCK
jgi:hypothetical protein